VASLTVDPYFLPGLLAKGELAERHADAVSRATTFCEMRSRSRLRNPLAANLRPNLEYAKRVVWKHRDEYGAYLAESWRTWQARAPPDRGSESMAGSDLNQTGTLEGPITKDCNQLHVPRLPEIPFHERSAFPWLSRSRTRRRHPRGTACCA